MELKETLLKKKADKKKKLYDLFNKYGISVKDRSIIMTMSRHVSTLRTQLKKLR